MLVFFWSPPTHGHHDQVRTCSHIPLNLVIFGNLVANDSIDSVHATFTQCGSDNLRKKILDYLWFNINRVCFLRGLNILVVTLVLACIRVPKLFLSQNPQKFPEDRGIIYITIDLFLPKLYDLTRSCILSLTRIIYNFGVPMIRPSDCYVELLNCLIEPYSAKYI